MNYRVDKGLKEAPLPCGFYCVCGEQGAGKTSLCTAMLSTDYRYHNKERLAAEQARVERLNRYGYNLKLPAHLYYTSHETCLTKTLNDKQAVKTHHLAVERLGLPNDDYEVQYFPWGSVIYISEADMQIYCQDWQKISKYLWNLIKYLRHNNLTVIFDLQCFDRLAIQLRKLCMELLYVTNSLYTPAKFFGLIRPRTTWYFTWTKPQQIAAKKELAGIGVPVKVKSLYQDKSFVFKGNVYQRFDSFNGEMYFLKGLDKAGYEVEEHPMKSYTPEGVRNYCAQMPLSAPEEDKK